MHDSIARRTWIRSAKTALTFNHCGQTVIHSRAVHQFIICKLTALQEDSTHRMLFQVFRIKEIAMLNINITTCIHMPASCMCNLDKATMKATVNQPKHRKWLTVECGDNHEGCNSTINQRMPAPARLIWHLHNTPGQERCTVRHNNHQGVNSLDGAHTHSKTRQIKHSVARLTRAQ